MWVRLKTVKSDFLGFLGQKADFSGKKRTNLGAFFFLKGHLSDQGLTKRTSLAALRFYTLGGGQYLSHFIPPTLSFQGREQHDPSPGAPHPARPPCTAPGGHRLPARARSHGVLAQPLRAQVGLENICFYGVRAVPVLSWITIIVPG